MLASQVAETILKYTVDDKSIRRALQSVQEVEDLLKSTSKAEITAADAAKKLNAEFAQLARAKAISGIADETIRLANETQDWSKALALVSDELANIGASEDEIRRVANALADAQDASERIDTTPDIRVAQGGGIDAARGAVGDLSTLFGAGASAIGGSGALAGVGDVLGLAEYIPLAGQALASLTPTMIGISGAALVLAPAIAAVTSQIEENTKRERARAEALQEVADAIVNGTRGQVQAQIAALEVENRVRETQIQLIERQTGRSREYLEELTRIDFNDFSLIGGIADLADTIQGLGGPAGVVVEANTQIETNTYLIDALSEVLGKNATAANDAAEAETELYNARTQGIKDGASALLEDVEMRRQIDQMDITERRARTAEIAEQISFLTAERDRLARLNTPEASLAASDLGDQLTLLRNEFNLLAGVSNTTADRANRVADALERQSAAQDLYGDLIDESFEALQREGEIREKAAQAAEDYADAVAKHEQAISDLRAQADTKRQDDETKAREDREKAERDHAKRIADIQRKTNATLANAIMARDALAYILAQQAAKEQIDSENDAYKERQKDIDDALKKQLASQDKALKEALAKEEARWRDEKATRDRAIAQIQNDLANAQAATASMQRQAAQQAFMIELDKEANLRGSYERQASIQSFYLDYMVSKSAAAWAAMASVIGGGSGIGSPGGAGAQPTPFADGGYVTRTGLALVHAGEKIYPPIMPAGRAAFGSSTTINQNAGGVTLNIRGNSPAQIRREVDVRLTDYFRAAGMV